MASATLQKIVRKWFGLTAVTVILSLHSFHLEESIGLH